MLWLSYKVLFICDLIHAFLIPYHSPRRQVLMGYSGHSIQINNLLTCPSVEPAESIAVVSGWLGWTCHLDFTEQLVGNVASSVTWLDFSSDLVSPWDSWAALALALEPDGWRELVASPEFPWFILLGTKEQHFGPFHEDAGVKKGGKGWGALSFYQWGKVVTELVIDTSSRGHSAHNGVCHQEVTEQVMGMLSGGHSW